MSLVVPFFVWLETLAIDSWPKQFRMELVYSFCSQNTVPFPFKVRPFLNSGPVSRYYAIVCSIMRTAGIHVCTQHYETLLRQRRGQWMTTQRESRNPRLTFDTHRRILISEACAGLCRTVTLNLPPRMSQGISVSS